ncbi:MAG: finger-like region [Proteobacteria bacterium]|nr:finger-like region [Pseudomonadota bacterium]
MMRTRCPNCATVFRITAEQLRVRFGMVRCGQCQAVFNAFDSLIEGSAAEAALLGRSGSADSTIPPVMSEIQPSRVPKPIMPEPKPVAVEIAPLPPIQRLDPIDAALAAKETPAESTKAARDAGLVAVRELSESPTYDRWSAGAFEAQSDDEFIAETPSRRLRWPFVLVTLVLLLILAAQVAYHFRSELAARFPDLDGVYRALNIEIPLPRNVDLVVMEFSDLQYDNVRGLHVLQATIRNRAPYAQAWPLLEVTLTDAHDQVVSRRVIKAADYLPAKADARAFAGGGEVGVRLWLESKQPAAGYRLFLFYP